MRILEHDELPSELEPDLQLLRASVGLVPRDFSRLRRARKAGYPSADYFGLYAVEGNRVLSTIRVLRLPYSFPDGHVEPVSAIMSVMTRVDSRGRGLVRGLLKEVHGRERKAGGRYSVLWCDLSIKAHGLYQYLGYKDIYFPDFATKRPSGRGAAPGSYALEKAGDDDVAKIGRIHAATTRGRIGFTPRPRGYLSSLIWYGLFIPDSFRVITRDGRPVGYLELQEGSTAVKVSEVVTLPSDSNPAELLPVLERLCEGRWLWLCNTFVRDSVPTLEERGYSISNLNNHVLMSLPLEKSTIQDQAAALGTADPRFVCHITDYF